MSADAGGGAKEFGAAARSCSHSCSGCVHCVQCTLDALAGAAAPVPPVWSLTRHEASAARAGASTAASSLAAAPSRTHPAAQRTPGGGPSGRGAVKGGSTGHARRCTRMPTRFAGAFWQPVQQRLHCRHRWACPAALAAPHLPRVQGSQQVCLHQVAAAAAVDDGTAARHPAQQLGVDDACAAANGWVMSGQDAIAALCNRHSSKSTTPPNLVGCKCSMPMSPCNLHAG